MVSPLAVIAIITIIGIGIALFISMIDSMADYSFTSKEVYERENNRIREDLNIAIINTNNNIITLNVTSKWVKESTINGIIIKSNNYYLCELNVDIEPLSVNNILTISCPVNFNTLPTFNAIVTTKSGNAFAT